MRPRSGPSSTDAVDDPRRGALLGIIERLARADITWEELARKTKKGLIPRDGWEPPPDPGPEAIPLRNTKRVLLESLAAADVTLKRPSPRDAWRVFVHFAQRPVRAPSGFHVTDDRCLAELHTPAQADMRIACTGRWSGSSA